MSDAENTGTGGEDTHGPGLEVFPGLDVNPDQLRMLGHVPVHSVAGVGPMEIWVSWGGISETGEAQGDFHRKRCGWDEARRLRELSTEIRLGESSDEGGRERLVAIAHMANVDVLSASEALAEIAPEQRALLLQRCRELVGNAGGAVTLERAIQLAGSVPNDDVRAPREVPEALLWLLGTHQSPDEGQGVLDWVLRHEERQEGLSGVIAACDELFEALTERRSSSTLHSRTDRASSLRFRVEAASPIPEDVVIAAPVDAGASVSEPGPVETTEDGPSDPDFRPRITRPDPTTWMDVLETTRQDVQDLRQEVQRLAGKVDAIGTDDSEFIAHANAGGGSPRWVLPVSGALLLLALVLTFAPGMQATPVPFPEEDAAPVEDASAVEAPPSAPESSEVPAAPAAEEAAAEEAVEEMAPVVKEVAEDPVPAEEERAEEPPKEVEVVAEVEPALEGSDLRPTVDSPEVAAERYGVGIQPTHRLIERSKLHRFAEKDFVEVTQLPGGDALVDACIVSLARNEEYRRKIYKGYHPVRLSCAGEMKVICEILGCPPEQSCVTAASWVKPCRN